MGDFREDFKKDLENLLNRYGLDNESHMPDFILTDLLVCIIDVVIVANKRTLNWHGCDSVCHPKHEDRVVKENKHD